MPLPGVSSKREIHSKRMAAVSRDQSCAFRWATLIRRRIALWRSRGALWIIARRPGPWHPFCPVAKPLLRIFPPSPKRSLCAPRQNVFSDLLNGLIRLRRVSRGERAALRHADQQSYASPAAPPAKASRRLKAHLCDGEKPVRQSVAFANAHKMCLSFCTHDLV